MKKSSLVSIVFASLLMSPIVLARHVQAEEVATYSQEPALTSHVGQPSTSETSPVSNEVPASDELSPKEEASQKPESNIPVAATSPVATPAVADQPTSTDKDVVAEKDPVSPPADKLISASPQTSPSPEGAVSEKNASLLSSAPKVTLGELSEVTGQSVEEQDAKKEATVTDAVNQLLKWASTKDGQVGATDKDRLAFAKSLGMISEDTEGTAPVTNLASMVEVAKKLHAAYRADRKEPLFLNGRAQPIFPFTPGDDIEHYSYEKSDIVRYIVYVETDYDTDGDGKPDLVKTLVQVPKAAVKGDYKAPSIFEASPYVTGTTEERTLEGLGLKEGGNFDMAKLYSKPEKRKAVKEVSTEEVAKAADPKEWYYVNPRESSDDYTHYDYENLNWYNYYLVRGYAVVTSSGLGSKGSDGINTTGSDLEIAAYKNIIEWLNGKRKAYADKTSNREIKADWSSGNVAMTGLSWAGTTTFGVASTGVEGLKTIVPAAGIASWYDHFNSQGSPLDTGASNDLSWLSVYTSGRILDKEDWDKVKDYYAAYITKLNELQHKDGHNYNEEYVKRDYTLNAANLKAAPLIIQGLNDDNVKPKHFELMVQAFKKAGIDPKVLLHQGNHVYPSTRWSGTNVAGQAFNDLMNLWYSHYLFGIRNGIQYLPEVTAQDNLDPSKWRKFDKWESTNSITARAYSKREDVTVSSDFYGTGENWTTRNQDAAFHSSAVSASYAAPVDQDITIKGHIPVNFSASFIKGDKSHAHVSATLMDVSDEEFDVVKEEITYDKDGYGTRTLEKETLDETGYWSGSNLDSLPLKRYKTHKVKSVVISRGWLNLANPGSGFDSASSSHSIDLKENEYHNYTMYLQPNLYTVKKGHRLVLTLHAFDPDYIYYADPYEVKFKTDSISARIPILEDSRSLLLRYQPNEKDTEYASLADRILPIAKKNPTVVEEAGKGSVSDQASHQEQQPPVGRDQMDFRKEQKEELAQLAHVSGSTSQGEGSVARLPEKEETRLPETGETANIWTVYGLLTVLATSLWKAVYRRKEDQ
ncbi:CocE/NonD family hydrolase [Streptococcus koreensis]|uniref:LPXTG cell wall anchor domain-containing protein n=1 Tax=Streptococcus koreensis TaxID=2382163 RepID=A0ABM6ZAN1_9STRE|nr:CocE/NonD family hydrolase [Streptococcus koreensis]AYF94305.1 LPXTG cell wall anchor domain-containing protein [Streptococcus koreensis]